MSERIVGIGLPILDITAQLSDAAYQDVQDFLQKEPGDWLQLSAEQGDGIASRITDGGARTISELLTSSDLRTRVAFTAGHTIVNSLIAMPGHLRRESAIITATTVDAEGDITPANVEFQRLVKATGLGYHGVEVPGDNPLNFVLSSESEPEKLMGLLIGASRDVELNDIPGGADMLVVDAYELQQSKLADSIDRLIRSGRYSVALALGNRSLLQDSYMSSLVRNYAEEGFLTAVLGNRDEFAALYPGHSPVLQGHPITRLVPYVSQTKGAEGSELWWKDRVYYGEAEKIDSSEIKNTSNVGDTFAGEVIAGIVEDREPQETQKEATHKATEVLRQVGGYRPKD